MIVSQVTEFDIVFNELEQFIKNNDISHINTPTCIEFCPVGKMYLVYSLSTARVRVTDLSEATFFIKNFLNNVIKK